MPSSLVIFDDQLDTDELFDSDLFSDNSETDSKNVYQQHIIESYEKYSIKYGYTEYPLRSVIKLMVDRDQENKTCYVYESVLNIRSEGNTIEEAKHKWIFEFHRLFQYLISLAPFEKTKEQNAQQKWFDEIIDMEAYWAKNPLHCHLKGRINKIDIEQVQIEWIGRRITNITYEHTPSDFLLFKENEWFDAVVELDFYTGDVLNIIDVINCGDPSLTPQQQDKFWKIVNS